MSNKVDKVDKVIDPINPTDLIDPISPKKAFFLDRDGVVIREAEYLSSVEGVHIFKETFKALKLMKEAGYLIIVVSNQSGVARGYFEESTIPIIHNHINSELKKKSVEVDEFYYCPHHDNGTIEKYSISCECRKPKTGMFKNAEKDFNIDLTQSFMIGDKISDIKAGNNANMAKSILVKSGHSFNLSPEETEKIVIKNNILDATKYLLKLNSNKRII